MQGPGHTECHHRMSRHSLYKKAVWTKNEDDIKSMVLMTKIQDRYSNDKVERGYINKFHYVIPEFCFEGDLE